VELEYNKKYTSFDDQRYRRGMPGAGELCFTFPNYKTRWEDKLERH